MPVRVPRVVPSPLSTQAEYNPRSSSRITATPLRLRHKWPAQLNSMVVIASMIGVQGLGLNVLQAIANQYFTQGIFNGFAIVGIAIIFDRISQAYGHRLQKHRGATHD